MRNAKMLVRHNGSIEISKYELGNSELVEEVIRKILYDERYQEDLIYTFIYLITVTK